MTIWLNSHHNAISIVIEIRSRTFTFKGGLSVVLFLLNVFRISKKRNTCHRLEVSLHVIFRSYKYRRSLFTDRQFDSQTELRKETTGESLNRLAKSTSRKLEFRAWMRRVTDRQQEAFGFKLDQWSIPSVLLRFKDLVDNWAICMFLTRAL